MIKKSLSAKRVISASKYLIFIIIILMVVLSLCVIIPANCNENTYIVTVTDKERVTSQAVDSVSSKYLVFTEDKNGDVMVFENTDTLLRMKFNSSDIQGKLKIGETYQITAIGHRVPFLSMYQNIIEVNEAE